MLLNLRHSEFQHAIDNPQSNVDGFEKMMCNAAPRSSSRVDILTFDRRFKTKSSQPVQSKIKLNVSDQLKVLDEEKM